MNQKNLIGIDSSIPPSPVPHLVGTNHPPSLPELKKVQSAVAEVQRRISAINDEIIRLENERRSLENFCEVHKPILDARSLSQYRRELLPELWAEIFLLSQGEPKIIFGAAPDEYDSFSRRNEGPLVLSTVCSGWRRVALSTPQLWTSIVLNTLNNKDTNNRTKIVDLWLKRSGLCPLTVQIINGRLLLSESSHSLDSTTHRLLAESPRWETLHLMTPSPSSWALFSKMRGNIPMLKHCILTWFTSENREALDASVPRVEIFDTSPQLRVVRVDSGPLFLSMRIPFPQLTSIDLANEPYGSLELSMEDCLLVLLRCSSLRDCKLRCGFTDAVPGEVTSIIHTQLLRLEVYGASPLGGELGAFFRHLKCPSLQKLVVKSPWMGNSQWDHTAFISFLTTIDCLLELYIASREISAEDAVKYLQSTPFLTRLHMQLQGSTKAYITTQLTSRADEIWPHTLPKLYFVTIENTLFDLLSAFIVGSSYYLPQSGLSDGCWMRRPT